MSHRDNCSAVTVQQRAWFTGRSAHMHAALQCHDPLKIQLAGLQMSRRKASCQTGSNSSLANTFIVSPFVLREALVVIATHGARCVFPCTAMKTVLSPPPLIEFCNMVSRCKVSANRNSQDVHQHQSLHACLCALARVWVHKNYCVRLTTGLCSRWGDEEKKSGC